MPRHADACRDAGPRRQLSPALHALAGHTPGASHAALTQAGRQMYGRATFDLLRKRVLLAT